MKTKNLILSLLSAILILSFIACENKSDRELSTTPQRDESGMNYEKSAPMRTETMQKETEQMNITQPDEKIDVSKRLVVKSGKISIEVDKYDDAETKITEITNKYGGNISTSASSMSSSGKKQGTITVRIPAAQFDAFIPEVSQIGKVMSQNINASDVTEEYIDLEARLKTQKELEQRLYDLLKTKTAGLSDVLAIENKLADVRGKIESTEGRMKYLMSQASFSTLAISVYEPNLLETTSGGGFFSEIRDAIVSGLRGLLSVIKFLIIAFIALLPFLIIAYIIYIIIRKKIRKKKQPVNT
ncbi:MAG: DUF4349 domain-containing protein [Ignavibacteria bacterium]|nr:DUF4349 domain-containing protein [Ignavibacteria bacterium]